MPQPFLYINQVFCPYPATIDYDRHNNEVPDLLYLEAFVSRIHAIIIEQGKGSLA